MNKAVEVKQCRACGSSELKTILDLGTMPLANGLLNAHELNDDEFKVPLVLQICGQCCLLQISHTVAPELLFRNYAYFSSFSDTMLTHSEAVVKSLIRARNLGSDDLVMEVASNDGYLLKNYVSEGIKVLGIEPALNIAAQAIESGIPTISEFFCEDLANKLATEVGMASVIHANNVMAHVPQINGFLKGINALLRDDGVAIIEVPYAVEMIDKVEFDTIYHEHVFYFTVTALDKLCRRNGLYLNDVKQIPIHGGSLQITLGKTDTPNGSVKALLESEKMAGFDSVSGYEKFAKTVLNLKASLLEVLKKLTKEGHSLAAYGAAAKGATLLNFLGDEVPELKCVFDRSTVKQGRFMPGVHLEILPASQLSKIRPDYVLILTWNFAEEIIKQQQEFLDKGGTFILPVPEPKFVTVNMAASAI